MPFVARPRQAATDMTGELLAKFACPLPYGFVADDDAARGQQLLHHAKTEREAEIQPHGMSDDLGREPIPGIAGADQIAAPDSSVSSSSRVAAQSISRSIAAVMTGRNMPR